MEEINRELLIKEISSRLAYGIKAQVLGWDEEKGEVEVPLKVYSINTDGYLSFEYNHYSVETVYVEDCHLYLRPMSSMTLEEREHLQTLHDIISDENYGDGFSPAAWEAILDFNNYCREHHLDNGGLITLGLALEAPEEMYNIK